MCVHMCMYMHAGVHVCASMRLRVCMCVHVHAFVGRWPHRARVVGQNLVPKGYIPGYAACILSTEVLRLNFQHESLSLSRWSSRSCK